MQWRPSSEPANELMVEASTKGEAGAPADVATAQEGDQLASPPRRSPRPAPVWASADALVADVDQRKDADQRAAAADRAEQDPIAIPTGTSSAASL